MNENSTSFKAAVTWTAVGILGLVIAVELAAAAVVGVVLSAMNDDEVDL